MIKVITYGTFDMMHYGHIRLLERAKALGDFLIVGITSDDYEKVRGKINLQQTLAERIESVRKTGLADQIIIEEHDGQKIDDIRRYKADIFCIGSDWTGHFDYLKDYCKVVYLERTEGISSSEIRSKKRSTRIGMVGSHESRVLNKYCSECQYVNGAVVSGICTDDPEVQEEHADIRHYERYEDLLDDSDALFILTHPLEHACYIRQAIERGKHVLVEMPVVTDPMEFSKLYELARQRKVVIMPAMKTAYTVAYNRLLLLAKSGVIGKVVSVDATCTSLRNVKKEQYAAIWNSICAWGPTAMLPVFQILGTNFRQMEIFSLFDDVDQMYDAFTKIDFLYEGAVASIKVGRGVKSEGELVISGTKGYIYVPSPWWKTDYFEVRYENQESNRRFFYQLDGEGIRYELVEFTKAIQTGVHDIYITDEVSSKICDVISDFYARRVQILH